MAKLFYQVKEENFSAKLSNWQHPMYCGKIQIIVFSSQTLALAQWRQPFI